MRQYASGDSDGLEFLMDIEEIERRLNEPRKPPEPNMDLVLFDDCDTEAMGILTGILDQIQYHESGSKFIATFENEQYREGGDENGYLATKLTLKLRLISGGVQEVLNELRFFRLAYLSSGFPSRMVRQLFDAMDRMDGRPTQKELLDQADETIRKSIEKAEKSNESDGRPESHGVQPVPPS